MAYVESKRNAAAKKKYVDDYRKKRTIQMASFSDLKLENEQYGSPKREKLTEKGGQNGNAFGRQSGKKP